MLSWPGLAAVIRMALDKTTNMARRHDGPTVQSEPKWLTGWLDPLDRASPTGRTHSGSINCRITDADAEACMALLRPRTLGTAMAKIGLIPWSYMALYPANLTMFLFFVPCRHTRGGMLLRTRDHHFDLMLTLLCLPFVCAHCTFRHSKRLAAGCRLCLLPLRARPCVGPQSHPLRPISSRIPFPPHIIFVRSSVTVRFVFAAWTSDCWARLGGLGNRSPVL